MSLIRDCQLDIMLFLMGVCAVFAISILVAKPIPIKSRKILSVMAVASAALLFFERCAYLYRGDVSDIGYCMVRLGNGMSFFLLLFIPFLVTQYIKDLLIRGGGESKKHIVTLEMADAFFVIGFILLVVSQLTGFYYTFDASNVYQRAPGLPISYVPPLAIVSLQMISLIRERELLTRGMFNSLLFSLLLPIAAALAQLAAYGVSWTCMATASVIIVYYVYVMKEIYSTAEHAKEQEIEFYRKAREMESEMFEQTIEALVNAIEAKDLTTRGHSARVAYYSEEIARRAGKSEGDCEKIYFTALLHDIGKIGILDSIINKPGRLTDDEYDVIKMHPVMGEQILSSIKQAPYLGIGARWHHERYDGRGYPDGLAGDDIPEIARIIAVADSYDVMTSKRSYHDPMPLEEAKKELIDGSGTQFDPRFAKIMIGILDDGTASKVGGIDGLPQRKLSGMPADDGQVSANPSSRVQSN